MKNDFRIKIIAGLYVLAIVILLGRSYQTNSKALSIIKDQFSLQQLYVAKNVAESIALFKTQGTTLFLSILYKIIYKQINHKI